MALTALIKASGKTLMTTAAVSGIGFVSSVITARVLGPEGRGLLSAALLISTLAAGISQFGLANSFIYNKGAARLFDYKRLMVVSLSFICTFSVLLALAGLQMSGEERHYQLPLISSLASLTAAQIYFTTLSQLHDGLHFFNAMRLGFVFGNLVLLLVLLAAFDSIDYQQILFTQVIVVAVLTLMGVFWVKRHSVWANAALDHRWARWKDVFSYGISYHGTVLLSIVLLNFDKIALLNMGTIVQYGFYALAFTISRLIGALQEAVSTALYARFAGRDTGELSRHVKAAFRLTFVPMLLLAAIGAVFTPWLVVVVYGEPFASMAMPLAILLFECVIGGASWTLAQRFNAGGRPGLVFVRQFISVLPVLGILPFLPQQNIQLYLSILMLGGSIVRLSVTLALYPIALREPVPDLLPTLGDIKTARRVFLEHRSGRGGS